MNLYLIGIILFVVILIVAIILYIYFTNDEKKLLEVSTQQLLNYGKNYTKEEFENKMFDMYSTILASIEDSNYNELRDLVSDDLYNQILLKLKQNSDNKVNEIVTDIKKESCKLIGFTIQNDLEIARLWTRYSDIEYIKGMRKQITEENQEELVETIISGSNTNRINNEYILTFVRNHSESENIVCPSCGYQTNILTRSKCLRCDNEIVPKRMHWVYVDKVNTNISKI